MPKISKVRIVNFNYNDGRRLIADELYDFESKEKDDALNVLINLANGGGKSVLVQLMMQPINPKAKVAGRRIESFFNRAGDHCFVLLEWLKDNSTEKLLTGIAMAASESTVAEDDSSRGMSVKYYTFYSNYTAYTSTYDIVNMPLSRKENGRFIAAEFDAVRNLARKSNGALNYYVADDNPKWQKKLAEYGLIQSEWRMIEKLNSEEGGLSKFFGDFKASDHLVDKLLIPTIESKLNQTPGREDNSLSTMLISYAKQYASKQEVLREKETYEDFSKKLTSLKAEADTLWNANDALEISVRALFGLSDALSERNAECQSLQEKYKADIESLNIKRNGIEHERASLLFYNAKEAYGSALKEYENATEQEQRLSTQLKGSTHSRLVLECAEYYKKLLNVDGELTAIIEEIARRESGTEIGRELANLKYSVSLQINELLSEYLQKANDLTKNQRTVEQNKNDCEKKLKESATAFEKAKENKTRADEKLRNAESETDREVQKYGFDIFRRLDGAYASDEIAEIQEAESSNKKKTEADLEEENKKLADIENEIQSIPQKKADLQSSLSDAEKNRESVKEALNDYHAKEARIKEICSEYNLNFNLRFTDSMKNFLESEQRKNRANYAEIIRKISKSDEEIKSAKRGSLHIPYAVIEYLNSTGVKYSTCEKYLTEQVENGKITNEKCLEILKNYPAAAFGVLMTKEDKERFFEYGREEWLPAMIPLFTYEQLDQILRNEKKYDGSIAFYSEKYFKDVSRFIEACEEAHNSLIKESDLIRLRDEKLKSQLDTVNAFTYGQDYEKEQNDTLACLDKTISEINANIRNLDDLKAKLNAEKENTKHKIKDLSDTVKKHDSMLEGIESILQRMSEEMDLTGALHKMRLAFDDAEQTYQKSQANLKKVTDELDALSSEIKTVKEQISELNSIKDQIGECMQADTVAGNWRELYAKYESMQASLNQELSTLKAQQSEKASRKKDYEKEIKRRELSLDEYKDVEFSEELLQSIQNTEKELQSLLSEATQHTKQAGVKKGKAEGLFDSANQALSRFGEPLDRSNVGSNFDVRLNEVDESIRKASSNKEKCAKLENKISATLGRLTDMLKNHNRPINVIKVALEDSFGEQFERMRKEYSDLKGKLADIHSQVHTFLKDMKNDFAGTAYGIYDAITGMLTLLSNEMRGDRYYTLFEHINGYIDNSNRAISRINTDLNEFENNRNDLIRQCVLQGARIYEGLLQMASSSKVTVYDGKDKKQMIRFDIPSEVDQVVANASITDEIDKGTKEIVAKLSADEYTDIDIKKAADKLISSKNLLRKYIGKETIRVDAYKIDQNPQNAGYRSWEQTQVNNSGAEKFVVYFAVILSLMNYTRGDFGGIRDKDLRSALILDNPFGATSSKHILIPMFAIAKHFRVQMICLSDINKSDVINCFDIVIKAIVKKRPMSNNELLTHEGNESIEHGFYRSEQLTFI